MLHDIEPKKYRLDYKISFPEDKDTIFVFRGRFKKEDRVLAKISEEKKVLLPTYGELKKYFEDRNDSGYREKLQYLFAIDETEYYLLNNEGAQDIVLPGYEYVTIRTFCDDSLGETGLAGTTAYHFFTWYRNNTYCGRCAKKMVPFETERALLCPSCHNLVFPKIMPAVIIAVRNGEKLLVSRYAGREYKGIALLAGFCEAGESMEQTVAREVMEETGVSVKNITYFGSQPWGLDANLLAGFYCDLEGSDELHIDKNELSVAGWIDRNDIEPGSNFAALTATMIEAFRTGRI